MTPAHHMPPQERVERLQQQVARLAITQQQLIEARDRLDQETTRLAGMQAYSVGVVSDHDPGRFADSTVEAVCDIFEMEVAVLWLADDAGEPLPEPWRSVGLDGERLTPEDLTRVVGDSGPRASTATVVDTGGRLGQTYMKQMVIAACPGPSGDVLAWLIAGIRAGAKSFHPLLRPQQASAFTLFATQVGALLQNRRDRSIILQQMDQLRVDQEQLSLALEGSEAGLWDWDRVAGLVYFSPRWKEMIGYSQNELGNDFEVWRSRVHHDDLPDTMAALERYLAGDEAKYRNEHRLRHRDGHYVWILALGRAIRDSDGEPVRMVGIHVDVTEQRAASEKADSANRAKSAFLATMSHEIRTPMNGVLGMLRLLRESTLEPDQEEYAQLAEESALSLLGLLDEVLDLSRIESGTVAPDEAPFDPAHELTAAARLPREQAIQKGLEFEVTVARDLPSLLIGDARRLRQVVTNLVANAVKFTEQGKVEVVIGGSVRGTAFELVIEVSDTGAGIAPENHQRIFEPFGQADDSTSRSFGGSGLGLTICREILDQMGGMITVESDLGSGAEFRVTVPLPVAAAPTTEPAPADVESWSAPAGTTALLVEDNAVNRRLIEVLLQRIGFTVETACDGADGCRRMEQGGIDVVFMDVHMPVMDGTAATRRIRQWEQDNGQPPTPILALTADVMPEARLACRQAGMDDYVTKPVTRAALQESAARWVTTP